MKNKKRQFSCYTHGHLESTKCKCVILCSDTQNTSHNPPCCKVVPSSEPVLLNNMYTVDMLQHYELKIRGEKQTAEVK